MCSLIIDDIREMSKCLVARVPPHEDCIVLIGTRPSITSAKLVLETQVRSLPLVHRIIPIRWSI